MAKKKGYDKNSENVAAALDALDSIGTTVVKSTAAVKHRIEELDDAVADLDSKLRDAEATHEKEMGNFRDQFTRETTILQTKLAAAEEKLRKVQQTLA